MKISEVMTTTVCTVAPEATLKEVAALLAERGISGLPVVGPAGELLGVVSETDIVIKERGVAEERGGLLSALRSGSPRAHALAAKAMASTAGEAMTSPAVSIDPDRPVAAAAALMLDNRVSRLPVVRGGAVVGIVTCSDLVRAFTRPDSAIASEIREDVLLGTFWLPQGAVDVTVNAGVVTLRGETETRTDAELVPAVVRRVIGVVAVDADLAWRVDGLHEIERRGA